MPGGRGSSGAASGTQRRTASRLTVVASVRHDDTAYDELLISGGRTRGSPTTGTSRRTAPPRPLAVTSEPTSGPAWLAQILRPPSYGARMTAVQTGHGYARELELQAAEYPGDRGEILLEAAHHWQRAGDTTRAIWLLEEVRAIGGFDAEYASASLADLCFERGDEQAGWAHIAALEDSGAAGAGPARTRRGATRGTS